MGVHCVQGAGPTLGERRHTSLSFGKCNSTAVTGMTALWWGSHEDSGGPCSCTHCGCLEMCLIYAYPLTGFTCLLVFWEAQIRWRVDGHIQGAQSTDLPGHHVPKLHSSHPNRAD